MNYTYKGEELSQKRAISEVEQFKWPTWCSKYNYLSSNRVSINGNNPLLQSVPRTCFKATNNSCIGQTQIFYMPTE